VGPCLIYAGIRAKKSKKSEEKLLDIEKRLLKIPIVTIVTLVKDF
jgi:hypothetical protein